MAAIIGWMSGLQTVTVALFGVILATAGWLYTSRRNRNLNRKQHTFNALLQSSFNEKYHANRDKIRQYVVLGKFPDDLTTGGCEDVRLSLSFILNYYEFIAAGVRNGEISERLLRDSERGTIVQLFKVSQKYVGSVRDDRNRRAIFEHLEWLYVRWYEHPPSIGQRIVERIILKPLYHDRHRWAAYSIVAIIAFVLVVSYLHLPGEPFNPITTP